MLLLLVILVLLPWPTSLIAFVVDRLFIHQKTSLIVLSVLLLKFQTISEIFQHLYFQFFVCTRSKLQSTMPLQFLQKLCLVNFVSMKTSLVVFKNTFNLTWFRLFHIFFSEDMKLQCLLCLWEKHSPTTVLQRVFRAFCLNKHLNAVQVHLGQRKTRVLLRQTQANIVSMAAKKHVGVLQIGYCLHCTIKKSKQ